MDVFSTYVTIARPMGDHPGSIEPGHYVVDGDMVTLTDQAGVPVTAGRMQLDYRSKIGEGETQTQAAQRLIWRRYRATKGGNDFHRALTYPNAGFV